MSEMSDSEETISTEDIFNKIYLASELRAHEEVNQKNLQATENKVKKLYNSIEEREIADKIVYNLTELRKHVQDLKLLEVEFNKKNNVLVETVAKERDVKNEIQNLKSRLEALEKMKAAHDKSNKTTAQESKIELEALHRASKVYSSNFAMNLEVTSEGEIITCKIFFKEKPEYIVYIDICKSKQEITFFHTKGFSKAEEIALKDKFNEDRNPQQFLLHVRNLVMHL